MELIKRETIITQENFVAQQKAYSRAHPGSWRMLQPIDPDIRETQTLSDTALKWFHYLSSKGFTPTYKYWKLCLCVRNQKIMVVSEDPSAFDPNWGHSMVDKTK